MSTRSRGLGVVLVVLTIGIIWTFARSSVPRAGSLNSASPSAVRPAPALDLREIGSDGVPRDRVSLDSYRAEKIVLVNFWATWCPSCQKELPDFATVAEEFRDDIVILAVNRGEPAAAQAEYLRDVQGVNLFDAPLRFLDDPGDKTYGAFGGYGMPVTGFVTKDGRLAQVKSGPMTVEEMRERIRAVLALK